MKTIFTFLFVGVMMFGFGQQNTFKVRAFAPDYSALSQLTQLNDGSFISIGSIYLDPNEQSANLYLLKTDANGNVTSSKYISNYGNNYEHSLIKTADGGFVICGGTDSNEAVVIKFKADLTIQWQKAYFISDTRVRIDKVLQTTDGDYLMAGEYKSDTLGSRSFGYVLKTDDVGKVLFSRYYSNFGGTYISDAAVTTDGNYALLAETTPEDNFYDTCFLLKIDITGTVLWSREIYSNQQNMELYQLEASSDGGLIMAGESYPFGNVEGKDYMAMVKYKNDGTLAWLKSMTTGSNTENYAYTVSENKDGGYVFAGDIDTYNLNDNYDSTYIYVVKTSASGSLQWTKTLNPVAGDEYTDIHDLVTTSDSGYAAAGEGYFLNTNSQDLEDGSFIYKYNSNFLSCDDTSGSVGNIQNYGSNANINAITNNLTTSDSDISITLTDVGEIGNVCSNSVLPLQLISFNATLQNKSVAINWKTANEVNTRYFIIERSKDAVAFTALQQVAAKGNSAGVQTYNTTDFQPLRGTSYYRLKETDKDGKVTYSSVAKVTVLNNGTIVISPNPVHDMIKVVMQSESNTIVACQVIDMKGSILAAQKTSVTTGRNEILIPAASLTKGVYMLKVIENNTTQTIRFVKE